MCEIIDSVMVLFVKLLLLLSLLSRPVIRLSACSWSCGCSGPAFMNSFCVCATEHMNARVAIKQRVVQVCV